MLKRTMSMLILICVISSMSMIGCNNKQANNQTEIPTATVSSETSNIENLQPIRFPQLNNADMKNTDTTLYDKAKLDTVSSKTIKDSKKENDSKTIYIGNNEFVIEYKQSRVYTDDQSSFVSWQNYDSYENEKINAEFSNKTGTLQHLSVKTEGESKILPMVQDFSENSLREAATEILKSFYGEEIVGYLKTYYRFEFGKEFTYTKSELDRYIVSFRSYINDIPTDDVIYVHFSLDGILLGISARRYLQYLDYNADNLFSKEKMDEKINEFIKTFEYEKVSVRDRDYPLYYRMNADGELYYVTEWECQASDYSTIEVVAIKAY